jgi:hypothetical protein
MFDRSTNELAARMAKALPGVQLSRADKKEVRATANATALEIVRVHASSRLVAEQMRTACELYDIGKTLAGDDQAKQQLVAAIIAQHVRGPNILGWQS